MIYFRLLIGLFTAWLLGYLIVYLFDPSKKLSLFEGIALSFLIGQGAISLLSFFLLLLVPALNSTLITTLLIAILFAVRLFFDKNMQFIGFPGSTANIRRFFDDRKNIIFVMLFILLCSLLMIKISYSFIEACSKPEYAWDASGNWTGIGKNIYHAQKYRPDKVIGVLSHESSYPRGISLMHYWLFGWMGEANDQWSKIIFPIEFLCLCIIFYYGLKPIRGQLGAVAFTYFLCSAPIFLYHSTIGYADLTKTVYFTVGIIYFYRWIQTKQNNYFWFFAASLAFTTWIKMEGKVLFAIGLALLLFYLWRGCEEPFRNKLFFIGKYLSLFIIIGLPWQLFIMFNRLLDPQSVLGFFYSRFFELHKEMYVLMFSEGSWGLFWVIAAVAMVFFFKRQITGENTYLFLAILLFYGNLLFVFLIGLNPQHGITAVFNRVLLPVYPVVVYNLGCIIPALRIDQKIRI